MAIRSTSTLKINREEAHRHARYIDPDDVSHHVSVFPEASNAQGNIRNLFAKPMQIFDQLDVAQHQGCGIFIAINAMKGNRRLKSEVSRVRAVHRDVDQLPAPELPLMPSLRITTSPNRWQDILLVDPRNPLSLFEAEQINRILVDKYGGDPHAKDLARLLRLAGTWHLKGEPYLTRIAGGNGRRYSRSELLAAFPLPPKTISQSPSIPPVAQRNCYIAAAVQGITSDLASASEGSRNSTLNWSAFRLGQLQVTFDEVGSLLTPIAIEIGLGHREITTTIRSGWTAGAAKTGQRESS